MVLLYNGPTFNGVRIFLNKHVGDCWKHREALSVAKYSFICSEGDQVKGPLGASSVEEKVFLDVRDQAESA